MERHDPEQVLILSGDHALHHGLRRDDRAARRTERRSDHRGPDRPWEQAPNFGTIHTDDEGLVTRFEEKPKNPSSNLISMGIYVFRTEVLLRALREITRSVKAPRASHLPEAPAGGARLQTHRWDGYWQDVGTIRAYFDSHMDLIDPEAPLDLRA
ncbi:MAG: sugar phosphate nucleotidyltransferase [Candidatus Eisenbacteria bacterium]